ncbi:MAG: hypothetical protein WKG06_24030 [Segetibacter sp.]
MAFAATTVYTLMFINSNAQKITSDLAINSKAAMDLKDAMDLVAIVDAPPIENNDNSILKDINPNAIKDFKKTFAVRNKTWHKTDKGFLASFSLAEIKNVVAYNNKGKWQHTIRIYNEDRLSRKIRATVKRTYYDYSITLAEEIHTADGVVYLVHMQDETTWKIVRVSADGEMELFQNLNKG